MTVNYDAQTEEVVLNRMLEATPNTIDKRQGSITRDMLSPASTEIAYLYMELANIMAFGFADTSYGEYLDLRCGEVGLTRKASVLSNGELVFTGEVGTYIPFGTQVSTGGDNPVLFQTVIEGTIEEGGEVTIPSEALVGGIDGNASPNTITQVIGNLATFVTVNNPLAFDGGADVETDEELLVRYKVRMETPATSGNKFQYEQWALSVGGVGAVKVYPLYRGNGTVDVVLLDTEMTATDTTTTQSVVDYIESVRPIGADVVVRASTEIPVNISCTLTLEAGRTVEEAIADITTQVKEYLKTLAFKDPIVRYTQIGTIIINSSYVLDYSGLTINGGTANIEINDGDVAVVGTVGVV